MDNGLSKRQHIVTRVLVKDHGADIFPSYDRVREAKKCCPPEDCLEISDLSAALPLQALTDHIAGAGDSFAEK